MSARRSITFGLASLLLCSLATDAQAQNAAVPFNPYGSLMPAFSSGLNGMSPQQLSTMMGMRMLQGYGGHGVQTGVPNPVMNGGFGSPPQLYNPNYAGNGTSKSPQTKRDQAKAARAEQKRAVAAAKAQAKADKAVAKARKPKSK